MSASGSTATLIIKAGPFFGVNAEPEVVRLQREMERLGCPYIRAHRQGSWIVIEGWKALPDDPGPLPTREFVAALIHDEVPSRLPSPR